MSSQIHFLLQVALLRSLVDGKVFMEWVGPAVLKAYQWQASNPTPEAVYPNNYLIHLADNYDLHYMIKS